MTAALLALLTIGAWSNGALDPRAVAAVLMDPLSIFAGRSPGERPPGALTQSKPARGLGLQLPRATPTERVLSAGRSRPPAPVEAVVTEPSRAATADESPVIETTSFDPLSLAPGVAGGGGGGAPFFVPPSSIGPGVGIIGEPGNPGGTDAPVSPVPEPRTWLTMMVGLLAIGGALRRKRARSRFAPSSGSGPKSETVCSGQN